MNKFRTLVVTQIPGKAINIYNSYIYIRIGFQINVTLSTNSKIIINSQYRFSISAHEASYLCSY